MKIELEVTSPPNPRTSKRKPRASQGSKKSSRPRDRTREVVVACTKTIANLDVEDALWFKTITRQINAHLRAGRTPEEIAAAVADDAFYGPHDDGVCVLAWRLREPRWVMRPVRRVKPRPTPDGKLKTKPIPPPPAHCTRCHHPIDIVQTVVETPTGHQHEACKPRHVKCNTCFTY